MSKLSWSNGEREVVTGANEVFVIDNDLKETLCKKDSRAEEIIRPYARPTEFTPYKITGKQEWFINSHNGILVSKKDWNLFSVEKDGKRFMLVNGLMIEVFRKSERRVTWIDTDYTKMEKNDKYLESIGFEYLNNIIRNRTVYGLYLIN